MAGKKKKVQEIDKGTSGLQMAPAVLFTAVVIIFVRMYSYTRNMKQFYWGSRENDLTEFFSHYKVVFIVVSAALAALVLLYRLITRNLTVKRSIFHYFIAAYAVLVVLSFIFSPYKEFAWHGWNDRFEGTYVLLCYMLMLFYIINFVKTERNVKQIVYSVAVVSAVLSFIGLSQYLSHDFFQTVWGQRLIAPNTGTRNGSMWRLIGEAAARGERLFTFAFQNREIYQTVYNINYVSFYLTLLIPLFILLFINEKKLAKKCVWGALFSLVIINLIGAASSSGFLGMFAAVIIAVIVLNKRLIKWWKSVAILLAITALTALCTRETWLPEISTTLAYSLPKKAPVPVPAAPAPVPVTASAPAVPAPAAQAKSGKTEEKPSAAPVAPPVQKGYFDYIVTEKNTIHMSYAGNSVDITANNFDDPYDLTVTDSEGKDLDLELKHNIVKIHDTGQLLDAYDFPDPRFSGIKLIPAAATEGNTVFKNYIMVDITLSPNLYPYAITNWPFAITKNGVLYQNQSGVLVSLRKVPHIGWEKNPKFGTYRGYIWSRCLPLLKDTIIIGHGADTFAIYFPHNDYVGQGLSDWPSVVFVDKPHNLYLGVFINTGGLSLACLLAIFLIYIVQSFILYRHEKYEEFCPIAGVGIFIGICGFLTAAITNDSSVSVMPMFYGLLGTGIAINMIVRAKNLSSRP